MTPLMPAPLTLQQRTTLAFIRTQAAEWVAQHGGQKLNPADPTQVGRAIGGAACICDLLCQALPEERADDVDGGR